MTIIREHIEDAEWKRLRANPKKALAKLAAELETDLKMPWIGEYPAEKSMNSYGDNNGATWPVATIVGTVKIRSELLDKAEEQSGRLIQGVIFERVYISEEERRKRKKVGWQKKAER